MVAFHYGLNMVLYLVVGGMMKTEEDVKPISYVKANANKVLLQVRETSRPLYITQNGTAKAVILDLKTYENMKSTIAMMKLIQLAEKDAEEGIKTPQDKVFKDIEDKRAWLKK
jgi:prevent-host-death family protein